MHTIALTVSPEEEQLERFPWLRAVIKLSEFPLDVRPPLGGVIDKSKARWNLQQSA